MKPNKKKFSEDTSGKKDPVSSSIRTGVEQKKYKGRAPISKERLLKHDKGDGINLQEKTTKITNRYQRQKLKVKEKSIKHAIEDTARAEVLLTEDSGYMVAEHGDSTTRYKQTQIAESVDITSAAKKFNLDLQFGPYNMRYSRNGRHLLLGGRNGHVAAFDWVTKNLLCEMNVMESVHDVAWLHIETMFAVAQKEWVYIYDNQGIELHCLKRMNGVNKLEFLPYHFLLASGSRLGYLAWLDVSIGKLISHYNTKLGRINVMAQNPANGVLCVGNSKGIVSMWSPNASEPLAKMLCHSQAIMDCAVHPNGTYMVTSCPNRTVKVWDLRQLSGPVHNCLLRSAAHHLSYSQRGLIGMASSNMVEIFRPEGSDLKQYLKHTAKAAVWGMQFCPYEDILGLATTRGYSSILVPGSGEANFDALESNPFQTKTQRREAEVKALLDKIQPEFITLDPAQITEIDVPTLKDRVEAKKKLMFLKPQEIDFKPRKTKAKGKGGTAKVVKTKKILKALSKKETIDALREANLIKDKKKTEEPSKDYGVLNRFLSKSKRPRIAPAQ